MRNSDKTILDLCGGTGSWSFPYRKAGYKVIIVDPMYTPEGNQRRFDSSGSVLTFHPPENVHGILAAPPCTHFAGSGAQWWKEHDSSGSTSQSIEIVRACLRIIFACNPSWWCLENPVGRIEKLVPELKEWWRWRWQPWMFGDPYTKRTNWWGHFEIPIKYITPVKPKFYYTMTGAKLPPAWKLGGKSFKTKRERSKTPPGAAMAFFRCNR